jgi:hypothetical protein
MAVSFGVFLLSDSFLRSSLQKFIFIGKKKPFFVGFIEFEVGLLDFC